MPYSTFREIIKLWPYQAQMARDVHRHRGPSNLRRKVPNVRVWHDRDRIPTWWHAAVVRAAEACGFPGVTYADLIRLYKARDRRPDFTPKGD